MFELELISLVNKYQNVGDYDKKIIETSITNLISENLDDYNNFITKQGSELSEENATLIKHCEELAIKKNAPVVTNEPSDFKSDFEIVKQLYENWLEIFKKNNSIPNAENEKIIINIINHYARFDFNILYRIFDIEDGIEFEAFKNMIKNQLRKHLANKVKEYNSSEKYISLNWFAKKAKDRELNQLLKKLLTYDFKNLNIDEVLK